MSDALKSHYAAAYGQWAGNQRGSSPDYDLCCATCHDKYHPGGYQCTRKRGYGPDDAFCKQHDPAAQAERDRVARAKYDAERRRESIRWAGASFLAALSKIADGHNDPRALAAEVIAPYRNPPNAEHEDQSS